MALNLNTELALINTNANAGTITLPSAASIVGRVINFKDSVAKFGTNALTLQTTDGDTFEDGSTTKIVHESNGIIQIVASGNTWYVLTGTQQNTLSVSTLQAFNVSSFAISTANLLVSSMNNVIYQNSTFVYYNSNIFAGTRVYPQTILNNSSFSPYNISGFQLWLDGADPNGNGILPTNGASISTWYDKSINKFNATQATASNQPTYILASNLLSFATNTTSMSLTGTGLSITANINFCSVFIVYTTLVTPSAIAVFNIATPQTSARCTIQNNAQLYYRKLDSDSLGLIGAGISTSNTPVLGVFELNYGANTAAIYINGTTNVSPSPAFINGAGNTSPTNAGLTQIGGANVTYRMAEILVLTRLYTIAQRQQMEGYLAWKWGLQANLPASHPYKNAPP